MKLEIGMYVRTVLGISKLVEIKNNDSIYVFDKLDENLWTDDIADEIWECELKDIVVKASYNIIELIKSKDIILGRDGKIYQCWKIYKDYVFTYSKNKQGQTITLVDYQIDKVLTKEQFEQMAYKVVE